MAEFQPPPTWADVILVDETTKSSKFNPVWLKWLLDIVEVLNSSGAGGGGAVAHNSTSGLQGGTTNEFYHMTAAEDTLLSQIVTGTWTPTLTNVTNLTGSTAYQGQYVRIGSKVIASGKVDADPTAAGQVQLGISLPVASNLGAAEDCSGTAVCLTVAGDSAAILGDAANNRAQMEWIAVDLTNQPRYFVFLYDII